MFKVDYVFAIYAALASLLGIAIGLQLSDNYNRLEEYLPVVLTVFVVSNIYLFLLDIGSRRM